MSRSASPLPGFAHHHEFGYLTMDSLHMGSGAAASIIQMAGNVQAAAINLQIAFILVETGSQQFAWITRAA